MSYIGAVIITFVFLSYLSFVFTSFCDDKLEKINNNKRNFEKSSQVRKNGSKILYTFLRWIFFNLFVLSFPIIINLSWAFLNTVDDGSYTDIQSLLSVLTSLSWFLTGVYIAMLMVSLLITVVEKLNLLPKKKGMTDEDSYDIF